MAETNEGDTAGDWRNVQAARAGLLLGKFNDMRAGLAHYADNVADAGHFALGLSALRQFAEAADELIAEHDAAEKAWLADAPREAA